MFEYLQLTLTANYKYFYDHILANDLRQDTHYNLSHYFLDGAVEFLFQRVIDARLKEDIKLLNPFLSFNFLDEVSGLEVKLQSAFGLRSNILEKLLLTYDGLLINTFEYENERFEVKIFEVNTL
jgi:hypothetical protein